MWYQLLLQGLQMPVYKHKEAQAAMFHCAAWLNMLKLFSFLLYLLQYGTDQEQ